MMQVEIITPDKKLFVGEATLVRLPGSDGVFEIMNSHAPIVSSLQKGLIKVIDPNKAEHIYKVTGGLVECSFNQVSVLTVEDTETEEV
jgi:F-type H+-transporting ATPase subunit epsilon